MSGQSDVVLAGGVQVMSRYPPMSAFIAAREFGDPDPWSGCERGPGGAVL